MANLTTLHALQLITIMTLTRNNIGTDFDSPTVLQLLNLLGQAGYRLRITGMSLLGLTLRMRNVHITRMVTLLHTRVTQDRAARMRVLSSTTSTPQVHLLGITVTTTLRMEKLLPNPDAFACL